MVKGKGRKRRWGKRALLVGFLASLLGGAILTLSPGESDARVIENGLYMCKP